MSYQLILNRLSLFQGKAIVLDLQYRNSTIEKITITILSLGTIQQQK